MEYIAYCKNNEMEFSVKYISEFRNRSKENKADLMPILKEYCEQNNLDMENIVIIATQNITKRRRSEKTKTSTEAKVRWESKAYKKYTVGLRGKQFIARLRIEDDKDLIDYIETKKQEGVGTTEIIRYALTLLKECEVACETDSQN